MHYIACATKKHAIDIMNWHKAHGYKAYWVEYNDNWYEVRYWY